MKILYFTKYSAQGASSRLRSLQYLPFLRRKGLQIEVSPLFSDQYLENLYNGKRMVWPVISGYLRRCAVLLTVWKYHKIVIEYELFPYLPAWPEIMLKRLGIHYIVDYDDAIFHNYDLSSNSIIRKFLSGKVDAVMKYSHMVVVGNRYLAKRAELAGASKVEIIPTVIDLDKYNKQKSISSTVFTIGWLGSPSTFKYVEGILEILRGFADENNAEVHIIGAKMRTEKDGSITYYPWSDDTEVQAICRFDVGIMPLDDTPWSRGKCGFKLIQYMACGVPVIASAVGANIEIVERSRAGLLVTTPQEWLDTLRLYFQNPDLRLLHGLNGRKSVEELYSVQQTAEIWYSLLTN